MTDTNVLFQSVCTRLLNNDFAGAISHCKTLLEEYEEHPTVRYNLALAHECQCNFVAAAAEYSLVISLFPKYAPAYMGLANCCLYEGDLETAEQLLRTSADISPADPRPLIMLSEILFLRGFEEAGIATHQRAVSAVDASHSIPTQSHVNCYMDMGDTSATFHMFLERSLIQREGYPFLTPPPSSPSIYEKTLAILVAHTGNAADIARRLATLPRDRVYLVTLDEMAARILADATPDQGVPTVTFDLHELPAIQMYIARHLTTHGIRILLPADDGRRDSDKLAWADSLQEDEDFAVSLQGDLFATPRATHLLDPRRVPPLYRKGNHPASDAFLKIFSSHTGLLPPSN